MAAGQLSWLEEIFTLNTVLLLDNMEPQLDFIIKPNSLRTDMEKGADARTLSAEIFENCGNFHIVEEYSPISSQETLHILEIFD